ncbi:MAG: DegQ family serine endoprotease [Pseudomonadota bacterium]
MKTGVLSSFLLLAFFSGLAAAEDKVTLRGSESAVRVVPQERAQVQYSYAPLVRKTAPAVVNVYAARQVRQRRSPFAGDPFFERFFGRNAFGNRPRQRTSRSLGSGVIVSADGMVITNHHVIKDADEVKVALSDGQEFAAEIVLVDKRSDLAVLQFQPDDAMPVVPLGDSEDLQVGDLVLALGNPFGVGQTVTSGIVSALARSQNGVNDFGFFIQTDASINPGNSGGALVDMDGRLIGINTAIYSRSGGSNGIGFAVPSNMVRVVMDSVRMGSSTVVRPWVGAQFQAVTPDIASSLGLVKPSGALVAALTPGGPSEKAGLKLGDIVLGIDGKSVPHVDALGYRLATAGLGRVAELDVLSRGRRATLSIRLDGPPEVPARDLRSIAGRSPFAGVTIANLSPRLAQELEFDVDKSGVVITEVQPRTQAARLGFRARDILVSVNDEPLRNTAMLANMDSTRLQVWTYVVERDGRRYERFLR